MIYFTLAILLPGHVSLYFSLLFLFCSVRLRWGGGGPTLRDYAFILLVFTRNFIEIEGELTPTIYLIPWIQLNQMKRMHMSRYIVVESEVPTQPADV